MQAAGRQCVWHLMPGNSSSVQGAVFPKKTDTARYSRLLQSDEVIFSALQLNAASHRLMMQFLEAVGACRLRTFNVKGWDCDVLGLAVAGFTSTHLHGAPFNIKSIHSLFRRC